MAFSVSLRSNLYAAVAGCDLVLLDIEAGRYDLIAGIGAHLSVEPGGRRLRVHDADVRDALREADLLQEWSAGVDPDLPTLPSRSALSEDPACRLIDQARIMLGWGEMVGHFYGRDLPRLIRRARAHTVSGRTDAKSRSDAQRLARAFYRTSPWIPFQGDCVFRAYMLLRLLQAHGIPEVRWVFGVATWPFYAHCWVQLGDESLSDWHEPLVRFEPIYAV